MKVPLLDLKPQFAELRDDIMDAIADVCESQYFIMGPQVDAFEKETADYCNTPFACGVSSGTDALLLALMAIDAGPGDAVLTTPYTFFATAGSIARTGAAIVFVDIDPVTYNIDPQALRQRLKEPMPGGSTPKAVIPVHLYGQCADMDAINAIAAEYELAVIEDAAQAIGAEYPSSEGSRRAGQMSDFGCFSFFPSKNLGGFGDGGMLVASDEALAEKARILRVHGMEPKYYHQAVGGNFRLDALQAAVLRVKLRHLEDWHARRRANAGRYDEAFQDSPLVTPRAVYADSGVTNYHIYNQYIVRVPDRDRVRDRLLDAGIGCEVYYPLALHQQQCFSNLGYEEGAFPESEKAACETLALPIYPEMTEEMQQAVIAELLAAVQ